MNTYKAVIRKITPRFGLKVTVELGEGIWHGETLALRGLDLPGPGSGRQFLPCHGTTGGFSKA